MDGLTRREIEYSLQWVARQEGKESNEYGTMGAYVVGGRDVLKSWGNVRCIIVFCPDRTGWRSKSNRVLADELAFSNQAVVVVPNLYAGDEIIESVGNLTNTERSVLDRLISTLHYCRLQYTPLVMCVGGVGFGATIAAHASCDLWDIASHSLSAVTMNTTRGKLVNSLEPDYCLGYASKVVRKSPTQTYDEESVLSSVAPITSATAIDSESESEVELQQVDDIIMGEEEQAFELSETEQLSFLESFRETLDRAPDTESLLKVSTQSFFNASSSKAETKTIAEKQKDRFEQSKVAQEQSSLKSSINKLTAADQAKMSDRSVVTRSLVSERATLGARDLVFLAPRALLCLNPSSDCNLDYIGSSLRMPTVIMYSGSDVDKHQSSQLHSFLTHRKRQIEDFYFRIYENASAQFLSTPLDDTDRKCRLDAVLVGSYWLSSYSRDPSTDIAVGSGQTKYDSNNGYFTVTRKHLAKISGSASSVAEYLHDDASVSLDYSQQDEESRREINSKGPAVTSSPDVIDDLKSSYF